MKYFKRLKVYKNHSGANVYNPETEIATSYGWWTYLKRFGDTLVFNNYYYSSTTCGHQNRLKKVIGYTGYEQIEAPKGLTDLPAAITHYEYMIKELEASCAKPRSHKAKNAERQLEIMRHLNTIEFIKGLQS